MDRPGDPGPARGESVSPAEPGSRSPCETRSATSPTLGLALSGGAVLGSVHIGVLKALDEAGVRVTHMAGTSMGALISSLYAFGLSGAEIEAIADDLRWPQLTSLAPSKLGFLSQDKLQGALRAHLGDVRLEDAPRPLALVALDISTGEKVVMTKGNLATAATASASFPGIFVPVEREGRLLVDGGLLENLPLTPLREWGMDRIVAVDAYLGMSFHRPGNIMELLTNAMRMILANSARTEVREGDILITPDLHGFSPTQLKDIPLLVEVGYKAAWERMDEIPGPAADPPQSGDPAAPSGPATSRYNSPPESPGMNPREGHPDVTTPSG
jgi:NTE family protein